MVIRRTPAGMDGPSPLPAPRKTHETPSGPTTGKVRYVTGQLDSTLTKMAQMVTRNPGKDYIIGRKINTGKLVVVEKGMKSWMKETFGGVSFSDLTGNGGGLAELQNLANKPANPLDGLSKEQILTDLQAFIGVNEPDNFFDEITLRFDALEDMDLSKAEKEELDELKGLFLDSLNKSPSSARLVENEGLLDSTLDFINEIID